MRLHLPGNEGTRVTSTCKCLAGPGRWRCRFGDLDVRGRVIAKDRVACAARPWYCICQSGRAARHRCFRDLGRRIWWRRRASRSLYNGLDGRFRVSTRLSQNVSDVLPFRRRICGSTASILRKVPRASVTGGHYVYPGKLQWSRWTRQRAEDTAAGRESLRRNPRGVRARRQPHQSTGQKLPERRFLHVSSAFRPSALEHATR